MEGLASRRWHKMNNTVCEIERVSAKLMNAKCHCMTHKNSIVKDSIEGLESERNRLYDDLYDQSTEWLKKLEVS